MQRTEGFNYPPVLFCSEAECERRAALVRRVKMGRVASDAGCAKGEVRGAHRRTQPPGGCRAVQGLDRAATCPVVCILRAFSGF